MPTQIIKKTFHYCCRQCLIKVYATYTITIIIATKIESYKNNINIINIKSHKNNINIYKMEKVALGPNVLVCH